MAKWYEYLVSYHHKTGTGTTYIKRSKKIESTADALELQKYIEDENGLESVGLLNIVLLRKFREGRSENG